MLKKTIEVALKEKAHFDFLENSKENLFFKAYIVQLQDSAMHVFA